MERIDSTNNARIREWAKLNLKKERDIRGRFLAEGEHLIEEALHAGIVEVILSDHPEQYRFSNVIQVPPAVAHKLCASRSGASSVAVCRIVEKKPEKLERILILDDVQDPGNLGTLIRTAKSFGFDLVAASAGTCDFYNEKVIRSTQGALFEMPVIRTPLRPFVEALQKDGVRVIATTLEDSAPLGSLKTDIPAAVILGNEGNGVSKELQELADMRVRIEMSGFESLNVAVAGGIMMYHMQERRIHAD